MLIIHAHGAHAAMLCLPVTQHPATSVIVMSADACGPLGCILIPLDASALLCVLAPARLAELPALPRLYATVASAA